MTGKAFSVSPASSSILITGGAKRIGRFLVEYFLKNSWKVIFHYNEGLSNCLDLKNSYPSIIPIQADFSNPCGMENFWRSVEEACGGLPDVLINNASVFEFDDLPTVSLSSFEKHQRVNLWAPLYLSQQFSLNVDKKNKAEKKNRCIINIIDQCVLNLTARYLSYTLSKVALWKLTEILAIELGPRIRVNSIAPGPTLQSVHQTEQQFTKQFQEGTLLKHPVNLEDIAKTVDFIINNKSLTGQMITVDCGQHLK